MGSFILLKIKYMSKVFIICQQCGAIRYVKPSILHSAKYCSRQCKDDAGQSKTTRNKISKSLTGYKQTEEHKLKNTSKNFKMNENKYKITGPNNYRWKGEKYQTAEGRWLICIKEGQPRMKYSRYIAEKYLKRKLSKEEVVHHINGDKSDDRPENLYVFPGQSAHITQHNLKNSPILISNII